MFGTTREASPAHAGAETNIAKRAMFNDLNIFLSIYLSFFSEYKH
jgi:hypothetical protein